MGETGIGSGAMSKACEVGDDERKATICDNELEEARDCCWRVRNFVFALTLSSTSRKSPILLLGITIDVKCGYFGMMVLCNKNTSCSSK